MAATDHGSANDVTFFFLHCLPSNWNLHVLSSPALLWYAWVTLPVSRKKKTLWFRNAHFWLGQSLSYSIQPVSRSLPLPTFSRWLKSFLFCFTSFEKESCTRAFLHQKNGNTGTTKRHFSQVEMMMNSAERRSRRILRWCSWFSHPTTLVREGAPSHNKLIIFNAILLVDPLGAFGCVPRTKVSNIEQ